MMCPYHKYKHSAFCSAEKVTVLKIQCEKALENIPRLSFSADAMDAALKTEDINELTEIIITDFSVTLKIIAAANTAAVRRDGAEIISVHRALFLIGMNRAKAILLGALYSSALDTRLCPAFKDRTFWKKSAEVGFAAQAIAEITGHPCGNIRAGAMSGGLLARIGVLFLAHHYPKELNKIILQHENEPEKWGSLRSCIMSLLGVDYDKLGVQILERWGLPSALTDIPGRLRSVGPSAEYDLSALVALAHLWAEENYADDSRALNMFPEAQKNRLVKMPPSFKRDAEMLSVAASA